MTAVSVVIPVFNERDNIVPLVHEVAAQLRGHFEFEVLCVDDHSSDGTRVALAALREEVPELRVLLLQQRCGQSAAIRSGVARARAAWVVTMDGDGQNDPADIHRLLRARASAEPDTRLFAGWRVDRRDVASRRWASRWANRIRQWLLHDRTPDTGCGIKLFERDAFLDLPYFDHMHRYLPALMQRAGWKTTSVPVAHRPRRSGQSKYDNFGRALVGIRDLMGVSWLIARSHVASAREMPPGPAR